MDIKWLCHKMSQALAGFVQAVPPGQGPGLPLLHLQMLAIVTSQAASDRATRAARERVMARIFQLSVSEDVYWFVCCWGLCCKTMQYHAISIYRHGPMQVPSGWQHIIDGQEKTETSRERESDAFAILQLLSYHVSLCLFCSVKAQLNEAHAVLSCPTQRLGPQVVHSYYQLKPAYWVIRSLKHTANCKPYLESLKGERRHRG